MEKWGFCNKENIRKGKTIYGKGSLSSEDKKELIRYALEAREHSYSPYSGYAVGAALLTTKGDVFTGCNVESASYGATNCAERTAVFKAVSEGKKCFAAIAIAGGKTGQAPDDYAYPCGVCRQVLQEFCDADFCVLVAKSTEDYKEYTLAGLLPYGFGGDKLK